MSNATTYTGTLFFQHRTALPYPVLRYPALPYPTLPYTSRSNGEVDRARQACQDDRPIDSFDVYTVLLLHYSRAIAKISVYFQKGFTMTVVEPTEL